MDSTFALMNGAIELKHILHFKIRRTTEVELLEYIRLYFRIQHGRVHTIKCRAIDWRLALHWVMSVSRHENSLICRVAKQWTLETIVEYSDILEGQIESRLFLERVKWAVYSFWGEMEERAVDVIAENRIFLEILVYKRTKELYKERGWFFCFDEDVLFEHL